MHHGETAIQIHADGFADDTGLHITLFTQLGRDMIIGKQRDDDDGNDRRQQKEQENAAGELAAQKTVIDIDHPSPSL